jgi:hypothetical protein
VKGADRPLVGMYDMLKSIGKPALLLKFGTWRCICIRNKRLGDGIRSLIRPLLFFGYACWCDKPDID